MYLREEVIATLEELNEEADNITWEASACQNKTVGVITKIQVEAKPRSAEEIVAFPKNVQLDAGCKDSEGGSKHLHSSIEFFSPRWTIVLLIA